MALIKKLFNQLDSTDQRFRDLNKSTKEVFEDLRRWNTTTGYKIPYQRPRLTTNYETNNFDPSAVAEYLNNFASEEQDNRYGGPFLLSDRKKREFYGRTTRRKSQSPAYNENYRKESHLRNDDQKMEENEQKEDVETELEPLRKETINFEPQQEDPPIDDPNQIELNQNIELIPSLNSSTARERLNELRRAETMKQNREFQKLKLKNTMIVALVVEDERVRRKAHIKEKLDAIGRPQGILLPDNCLYSEQEQEQQQQQEIGIGQQLQNKDIEESNEEKEMKKEFEKEKKIEQLQGKQQQQKEQVKEKQQIQMNENKKMNIIQNEIVQKKQNGKEKQKMKLIEKQNFKDKKKEIEKAKPQEQKQTKTSKPKTPVKKLNNQKIDKINSTPSHKEIKDPISLEITSESSVVHTPKAVRSSN